MSPASTRSCGNAGKERARDSQEEMNDEALPSLAGAFLSRRDGDT